MSASLYPQVISNVLAFLSLREVLSSARVCRTWCEGALLVRGLDVGEIAPERLEAMHISRFRLLLSQLTVTNIPIGTSLHGLTQLRILTLIFNGGTFWLDVVNDLPHLHTLIIEIDDTKYVATHIRLEPLLACQALRELTFVTSLWMPDQFFVLRHMNRLRTLRVRTRHCQRVWQLGHLEDKTIDELYGPSSSLTAHLDAAKFVSKDPTWTPPMRLCGDLHLDVNPSVNLYFFAQYAPRVRSLFMNIMKQSANARAALALATGVQMLHLFGSEETNLNVLDVQSLHTTVKTLSLDGFRLDDVNQVRRLLSFQALEHLSIQNSFLTNGPTISLLYELSPQWPCLHEVFVDSARLW